MARLESISEIAAFVRIVAAGSLSAAAREMDLSLAVISKRLIRLENAVGTRLVNRSTRHLSLTDDGREFHRHCLVLLERVRRAEEAIIDRRDGISGLLRVTAPAAFARRQIAPRLQRFFADHPLVKIEIIATDDWLDIVREGLDLAIRQGNLPDSDFVARSLATDWQVLCAAPAYLDHYGRPCTPADLKRHRCIVSGDVPAAGWTLTRGGETETVDVEWALHSTVGDVAHAAVLGGAGIGLKSVWDVAEDLRAGHLVEILPGWRPPVRPISAVFPNARQTPPRVRAFVEFLARELKTAERKLQTCLGGALSGVVSMTSGYPLPFV